MNRSEIMSGAWRIARQRQDAYEEPLRESLTRGLSVAWSKARLDESVRVARAQARARAENIARTMSPAEIEAELRAIDYKPRAEARISDLRMARHIQKGS